MPEKLFRAVIVNPDVSCLGKWHYLRFVFFLLFCFLNIFQEIPHLTTTFPWVSLVVWESRSLFPAHMRQFYIMSNNIWIIAPDILNLYNVHAWPSIESPLKGWWTCGSYQKRLQQWLLFWDSSEFVSNWIRGGCPIKFRKRDFELLICNW